MTSGDTVFGPIELTGRAVNDFITTMLPLVQGQPVTLFSAAAITLILCSIRPEISEEELTQGLRDVSSYITIWISELDSREAVLAGEPVARVN